MCLDSLVVYFLCVKKIFMNNAAGGYLILCKLEADLMYKLKPGRFETFGWSQQHTLQSMKVRNGLYFLQNLRDGTVILGGKHPWVYKKHKLNVHEALVPLNFGREPSWCSPNSESLRRG